MTNALTLTHTEAATLLKLLESALVDNNLDTLQIVSTANNIHVVRVQQEMLEKEMD